MRVAILYICTGRYDIFWNNFFKSSEKFFLKDARKEYFIFSDSDNLSKLTNDRIHFVYQDKLGWPYDTLMRFKMFMRVENELAEFDYIFFINANMIFLQPVGVEILPTESEGGLVAVKHPGFYNKTSTEFTFERNTLSKAYIPFGQGKYYFMGGFNGGNAKAYLQLIKHLKEQIEEDLSNNIIALWHDESHLNQYLLHHTCKVLEPSYGYPEGLYLPFECKILIQNKNKYGGLAFIRNKRRFSIFESIVFKLKKIKWTLFPPKKQY
jgi:hypothetical protein